MLRRCLLVPAPATIPPNDKAISALRNRSEQEQFDICLTSRYADHNLSSTPLVHHELYSSWSFSRADEDNALI